MVDVRIRRVVRADASGRRGRPEHQAAAVVVPRTFLTTADDLGSGQLADPYRCRDLVSQHVADRYRCRRSGLGARGADGHH
ncbi:hypothetical protein GCM10009741_25560 [Kribbella lupini]|uniref:Uncharacterized protein n=1 Tax=Kribbella lupini TaxID=291602 RepID=A0ABN2AQ27_9ACTN